MRTFDWSLITETSFLSDAYSFMFSDNMKLERKEKKDALQELIHV